MEGSQTFRPDSNSSLFGSPSDQGGAPALCHNAPRIVFLSETVTPVHMESTTLVDDTVTAQIFGKDVFDSKGDKVQLRTVVGDAKTVVVFIRHFFCGNCQQYVLQLASVRQEALDEVGAKIIIIGCGEWKPIASYADLTGFQGPILADPSRELYQTLGLIGSITGTPAQESKKNYISRGFFSNVFSSLWQGPLKHPDHIGKQGNIFQLGGEFIFSPSNECLFAHRMQHTEDHTEVAELMQKAGVAYP